jgi:hypothetical protein
MAGDHGGGGSDLARCGRRAQTIRAERRYKFSLLQCIVCGLRPIWAHGTHKDYDKIDVKEVQHDG